MRVFLFLVVLFVFGALGYFGGNFLIEKRLSLQADEAYEQVRYEETVDFREKYLVTDPRPIKKDMLGVAHAMVKLEKFDEAREIYRDFEPFMNDGQKRVSLEQIYYTYSIQGQTENARKVYEDLQTRYPRDENLERMGFLIPTSLMLQKRYEEAIREFQRYIENHPNSKLTDEAVAYITSCYKQLESESRTE